eukprot:scaffold53559_cov66-Phaeocystis_antarctica.AAC.6
MFYNPIQNPPVTSRTPTPTFLSAGGPRKAKSRPLSRGPAPPAAAPRSPPPEAAARPDAPAWRPTRPQPPQPQPPSLFYVAYSLRLV